MNLFASLTAFVAVVESGGFAKAARKAGQATSSLTRQVDALEGHLGVQLLNRSTRRVSLTPAGESYYRQVLPVLADLAEANRSVCEAEGTPRGSLRVSLPVAFARLHVAPALGDFLRAYPEIVLDLTMTDSLVDLVEERLDLAIRLGALESSSLIARKLAPHRRVVCASPDYLAARGRPARPEDLVAHNCLKLAQGGGEGAWRFSGPRGGCVVAVKGSLRADNAEVLREAALCAAGIVLLPTWLVGKDLRAGRLELLLGDWEAGHSAREGGVHAVYLPSRRGSPKVAAFVGFLGDRFGSPPYWEPEAA
ncbi:MAG: LysR family transcriptional regulator [Rhodospirillales bacterium]